MKKILRKYEEIFLVMLALILLAFIVIYFAWGVGYIVSEVNSALGTSGTASQKTGFNLQGAQSLDWRGLVNQ